MRRGLVLGAVLVLVLAPRAGAFDAGREALNATKSVERFADEATPSFQAQVALQSLRGAVALADVVAGDPARSPLNPCSPGAGPCVGEVRLYDWGERYGAVVKVQYVNRNGALISGHLWAPLPKRGRVRRRPVVLIVNGDLAPEQLYWWAAQVLARAGYVVMTFDPQGHGLSDTFGTGADVTRNVAVQQLAGTDAIDPAANADIVEQTEDALGFLLSSRRLPYLPARTDGRPTDLARPTPGQAKQRERAARGVVDRFDPLRSLVDGRRLGVAGHSRGADAASIVGARDPRVDAIVAWDNLLSSEGDPPTPLRPRVPALGMGADYYEAPAPYTADPDPQAKNAAFAAYRRAGVDAMEVTLRGGTHYEWSYAPNPAFPATLRGIDMAAWYTQAWFDKYLRHDRRADRRLLTGRWRADRAGAAVDPRRDGNLFSFYYRSRLAIHVSRRVRRHHRRGRRRALVSCADLRAGCRWLVPKRLDGYRGEYSYLRAARGQ